MKVSIVYWSGTGNTEAMANAVAEGAKGAGAEVELLPVSAASEDVLASDALILGCPAMGAEQLDRIAAFSNSPIRQGKSLHPCRLYYR